MNQNRLVGLLQRMQWAVLLCCPIDQLEKELVKVNLAARLESDGTFRVSHPGREVMPLEFWDRLIHP